MSVSNSKKKYELIYFDFCNFLGEPGGCGFCASAVTGLQGDRGSQGYRGRPGVSIRLKTLTFFFMNIIFIYF